VKFLIHYSAYINRCHYTISYLFACAVQKGYKSLVKYLLNKGADINTESLIFILIIAYNKGHYNIIEYFINRGANINTQTNYRSLLNRACAIGCKNIILLLIQNRAKINYLIKIG